MATPNMSLILPVVSSTIGPAWATQLNTALTLVDSHNHSAGQGVQVPTAGININLDLPFNGTNATLLRSTRFTSQPSPLVIASDANCLYVSGGNLYYNNGSGTAVQITSGATLSATSLGGISGLAATTGSAAYSSISGTFTWQSNTNVAATMDMGPIVTRDTATSALGITIKSPSGLAGAYALTLPAALPGATKILTVSATGIIGDVYDVDNSTIEVAANVIRVKDLGITGAKIANGTIGSTQVGTLARSNLPSVGQQISSTSGTGTYSGAKTDATVTGTATITTTGRPVLLILQPDGTNPAWTGMQGNQIGNLNLSRGGVDIATWQFNIQAGVTYGIPISPIYLDVVGAGTYAYKMTITQLSGISNVNSYVLVAYEL